MKCFYLKKNYLRVAGDLDLSCIPIQRPIRIFRFLLLISFVRVVLPSPLILPKLSSKFVTVFILHYRNFKSLIKQPAITLLLVPGIKMQCSNSNSNSSGGGLIDRKPSYFGHPAGSVTLSSLSSLSSLNLSNIGGLSSGLSISNIPGTVSSNVHHTTTAPPTTMYYDPIKYSMSNV